MEGHTVEVLMKPVLMGILTVPVHMEIHMEVPMVTLHMAVHTVVLLLVAVHTVVVPMVAVNTAPTPTVAPWGAREATVILLQVVVAVTDRVALFTINHQCRAAMVVGTHHRTDTATVMEATNENETIVADNRSKACCTRKNTNVDVLKAIYHV